MHVYFNKKSLNIANFFTDQNFFEICIYLKLENFFPICSKFPNFFKLFQVVIVTNFIEPNSLYPIQCVCFFPLFYFSLIQS